MKLKEQYQQIQARLSNKHVDFVIFPPSFGFLVRFEKHNQKKIYILSRQEQLFRCCTWIKWIPRVQNTNHDDIYTLAVPGNPQDNSSLSSPISSLSRIL